MSNYGPPGPHGQPTDPWQDADPFTMPGHPDPPVGHQQPVHQPAGYQPVQHPAGYPPQSGYPAPYQPGGEPMPWQPAQPGKRSSGILTAALAAAVVVVLGGAGIGIYLATRSTGNTPGATNSPTVQATGAATTTGGANSSAESDFRTAQVGTCLVNRGTDQKPEMHVVSCTGATYKVHARFDGKADKQIAQNKCATVPDFTGVAYWYHVGSGTDDFVLCLDKL